ncbi:Tim44/TimA family putative adaptor protein [Sphingomonas quercus]|uniref:Tim44/TimA family putative adaptor protein n=1 Tax=Sphingomonas quercus TaxID=2842451 RepID=A0ABS6BLB5_9SPHN|nr:Tim44/TimA family putative adaptor protein [Sphingomonas quercus]
MVTIVILAMVAAFVALRLYTVLGRRTGHEQQPLPLKPVEDRASVSPPRQIAEAVAAPAPEQMIEAQAREGLRAIVSADPSFDAGRFLEGAKSAYRMTLEAFWAGDEAALARLCDEEVRAAFVESIEQRRADGHVLDNRLVTIENAAIQDARLYGSTALVTVRFDADIAAVTRDADGNVVAGSLTDAVPTHDLWTFSRQVKADDPNWVLVETDDAA